MSLPVAYGSHEPDPEGLRVLDPDHFTQIDKGYALGLYLRSLLHENQLVGLSFPVIPENIGRFIVPQQINLELHVVQQN